MKSLDGYLSNVKFSHQVSELLLHMLLVVLLTFHGTSENLHSIPQNPQLSLHFYVFLWFNFDLVAKSLVQHDE